ncbi:translocon-associated protein subunit beta-like [Halichondria panicea]|uniref:translocon-associated protein subunit beta-like n=1 Tax=Halichondria panicea TaxID=6063 RepID=UPI00312B3A35
MYKLLSVLLLSVALCGSVSYATPHLLVSKMILNEYVVEGKDLTIQYSVFNVGTSPAQTVTLEDDSFPKDEFVPVSGMLTAKWERVNQDANLTHIVIIKPLQAGIFNMSWAQVTYTDADGITKFGFSSAPGVVEVVPYTDFARAHEHHMMEWLAFMVMSAPTILLPFLMWYRSHSKYEDLKTKKA